MKEAQKRVKSAGYDVESIRWHGRSRFRSEAKVGDLVIDVYTRRRGKRKYVEVSPAAPILHRQDARKWTRFYLEGAPVYYVWREIKADFTRLGIRNITPNSTRELTGKGPRHFATDGVGYAPAARAGGLRKQPGRSSFGRD
jgi:hypothetical protein